jgi:hypothetical protein
MLSRHSLKNLLEISIHTALSLLIHTLEICVDHLTESLPSYHPGTWDCLGDWETGRESGVEAVVVEAVVVEAVVVEATYRRCVEDLKILSNSGLDIAYLTRAFVNLPNWKNICITDTHQSWGACSLKR